MIATRHLIAATAVLAALVPALAMPLEGIAVRDTLIEGALQGGKTWAYATADLIPELVRFAD